MCSAGGPFEVNLLDVGEKEYRCDDCGKRFRDASNQPLCPACLSDRVVVIED